MLKLPPRIPAFLARAVISLPFRIFMATVALAMLLSQLGFLIYGAIYWSSIRRIFALVEQENGCPLRALVSYAEHMWCLSMITPGLAPIAAAIAIVIRTDTQTCTASKTEFVRQANNEFYNLYYEWRDDDARAITDENWGESDWFQEWFDQRCDLPHDMVTASLGLLGYAGIAVVGVLALMWVSLPYIGANPVSQSTT
jgi:hypothetical protein